MYASSAFLLIRLKRSFSSFYLFYIYIYITTSLFGLNSIGVLAVKTWQEDKGYTFHSSFNVFCTKKKRVNRTCVLKCWDGLFFWDVPQRKNKHFPLDAYGIWFLPIDSDDGVPCDLIMVLALNGIWKSRMAIRHLDIDAKRSKGYFSESIQLIFHVRGAQADRPECCQWWKP